MARFERIVQDFDNGKREDEIGAKFNMDDDDWSDFYDELSQAIDGMNEDVLHGYVFDKQDQEWYDTLQGVYKRMVGGTRG